MNPAGPNPYAWLCTVCGFPARDAVTAIRHRDRSGHRTPDGPRLLLPLRADRRQPVVSRRTPA